MCFNIQVSNIPCPYLTYRRMETLQFNTMYDFNFSKFPQRELSQSHSSVRTGKPPDCPYKEHEPSIAAYISGINADYSSRVNKNNNIIMDYNHSPEYDLEPMNRPRCNTWPLRPITDSPSLHDSESNPAEVIKEEPEEIESGEIDEDSQHNLSGGQDSLSASNSQGIGCSSELGSQHDISNAKKSTSRKNAWGNLSYADLITKAINSTPDKKLTLAQIYDWMVQNVSYFRDKGDSTSSAGWKNSIRHNLSLHNRFMRMQNEGAGKSSWWVINPDAKPGKAPRRPRGGSMDSKNAGIKKSREKALERIKARKAMMKDGTHSPVSPGNDFTLSPGEYRARTDSFASNVSGRRSPDMLDNKLSPWGSEGHLDAYLSDYPMDTGASGPSSLAAVNLPDDLQNMMTLQGGSFMKELQDLSGSTDQYIEQGNMYHTPASQNKPYTSYIGESNNYNAPPPPYPTSSNDQQNQAQFSKININTVPAAPVGIYAKDPMMTSYTMNNGNNNNLGGGQGPRQFAPYSNGVIPSRNINNQPPSIRVTNISQTQQRAIPSSIRDALHQNNLPNRPTGNQNISQSLKDSAPILTQQLMDYQPQTSQPSQVLNHQQQQYGQYQSDMTPGMFTNSALPAGTTGATYGSYFTDIDFDNIEQIPELSSFDVDEVIQEELRMDGGQLDFAGFDGYSSNQQNMAAQSAGKKSSSNSSGNIGVRS